MVVLFFSFSLARSSALCLASLRTASMASVTRCGCMILFLLASLLLPLTETSLSSSATISESVEVEYLSPTPLIVQ